EYLDRPASLMPGIWIDTQTGKPLDREPSQIDEPYLTGWGAFERHPELLDDIEAEPACLDDWVPSADAADRAAWQQASGREYPAMYLGRTGTSSPPHQDWWSTYSCLTQIAGHKHVTLYAPDDSDRRQAYDCEIGPGDTLFIPPDWWHSVRSIDHTITFSRN